MKRALVIVFLVLIMGFGVIGVKQASKDSEVITPDAPNTVHFQS